MTEAEAFGGVVSSTHRCYRGHLHLRRSDCALVVRRDLAPNAMKEFAAATTGSAIELLWLETKIEQHFVEFDFNWPAEMESGPQIAVMHTKRYRDGLYAISHAQKGKARERALVLSLILTAATAGPEF